MKFKSGQTLYYVSPFVFTIEKVLMECGVKDKHNPKLIYYICEQEKKYREIERHDLCETVEEAKRKALDYLNRFYRDKEREIKIYIDSSDPDWK